MYSAQPCGEQVTLEGGQVVACEWGERRPFNPADRGEAHDMLHKGTARVEDGRTVEVMWFDVDRDQKEAARRALLPPFKFPK